MSGYEKPNFTQVPNAFIDRVMAEIETVTELKVTLAVIRQTFGFQKEEDQLSITRLQQLTGLSRPAVIDGTDRALKRGSLVRRKCGQSYSYRLKVVKSVNHSTATETEPTSKERLPEVVNDVDQQLVNDVNPQKKRERKERKVVVDDNVTHLDSVTRQCLLLLKEVKNFPRDNKTNGERLSEYREQFPSVDAVEVVKDFVAHAKEKPIKAKSNPRLMLRNFFKQASKRGNGGFGNEPKVPRSRRVEDVDPEYLEKYYKDLDANLHPAVKEFRESLKESLKASTP